MMLGVVIAAVVHGVSRAQRSMKRSEMMRCRPGTVTHTAFAMVPTG